MVRTIKVTKEPTSLIVSKEEFGNEIKVRIEYGKNLMSEKIQTQIEFDENKRNYYRWNDYNSEYLKQSFNNEHNEYKSSYDSCADLVGFKGLQLPTAQEVVNNHIETIRLKVENLEKLEAKISILKSNAIEVKNEQKPHDVKQTNEIFIVHGHDVRIKIEVARTIEKIGLTPIILSEQPNGGLTIIEKFERYSNVGFAIILLTADDLGKVKIGEKENYRARQNVILEMGYFIGKLGRAKVFPLHEHEVELPSDLHGILYVPMDASGAWKMKLIQELKATGYNIDSNSLI